MTVRFARYVALGDSTTEGMDDPDGAGGYTTHDENVTLTSLPTNSGTISGDPT